jgi:hypothetical protein
MRLECCFFAVICVAAVVGNEQPDSAQGRGVRGSYVKGEDTVLNKDEVKEDEDFWSRLMQEDAMSVVVPTEAPHTHAGEPPTKAPSKPPTNPSRTPQVVTPTPDTPSPVVPTVPPTSEGPVSTPAPTTNVLGVMLPSKV